MRRSSFPPELQKFVSSIEKNAQAAGHSDAVARIFGAWAACFVRFCTVHDRGWRDPKHAPAFLRYLENRQDVDAGSCKKAAESLAFLFETLLKVDVRDADWHPSQVTEVEEVSATEDDPHDDDEAKGEQSTLLTRVLFHTSLPINEALELCAGDVDLDAGLIYVSDPMGTPKQIIELPDTLIDPLRRHLERLRKEHGRRYFDAPLFQARALQGRVDSEDDSSGASADQDSEPVPADGSEESSPSGEPSSLWGYADEA